MRVEDAVKDFWGNRPRRPRRGRKIAGVASGIANRYRIDPVLVRVAFVVAAIYGGSGVLLYLLGWLFLPEQDDEASPIESVLGKGRSSTSSAFTVLLCILTVPTVGWFFSGSFTGEFASWVSLLIMGGLLFMLHQTRGHLTPVSATPPDATQPVMPTPPAMPTQPVMPTPPVMPAHSVVPPPAMPQPTMPLPGGPATARQPVPMSPPVEERSTPPAWDPLGAAPFAWDLPDPAPPAPEEPPPPPAKRRKPKVATATIGVALMAVAALSIVEGGWINEEHIVGVALAIVGLGLVAGAFLRAGRGLIAIAVPLSLAGMAMSSVGPSGYQGMGDVWAYPTTVAEVLPSYERSIGNVELDLTGLTRTAAPGRPDDEVITEVHTDIGNATVIVPEDADVTVTCSSDVGNVSCLSQAENAPDALVESYTEFGPDGPGGMLITLNVSTDTGNVEVRRG